MIVSCVIGLNNIKEHRKEGYVLKDIKRVHCINYMGSKGNPIGRILNNVLRS